MNRFIHFNKRYLETPKNGQESSDRQKYIAALRKADHGDIQPLLAFAKGNEII